MVGTSTFIQKARGILLLMASVGRFGALDSFSNILVDGTSFGQVMLARYSPELAVLLIAARPQHWKDLFATRLPGLLIIRGIMPLPPMS